MKLEILTSFHRRLIPPMALMTWALVASEVDSFAVGQKFGRNHIVSVDPGDRTIVVTNMSLGKPITLKVDDLMTEILIDNKKARFEAIKAGMDASYSIGVSGRASRIAVRTPPAKSVYRH